MRKLLSAAPIVLAASTAAHALIQAGPSIPVSSGSAIFTPYAEARLIIAALRDDLLPTELRPDSARSQESVWPRWVTARDAAIRARLAQGDEDSIVNWLLFGVTFTAERRLTRHDLDDGLVGSRGVVEKRIADLVAHLREPASSERLTFVRDVLRTKNIDPDSEEGRKRAARYLDEQLSRVLRERKELMNRGNDVLEKTSSNPGAAAAEARTFFDERGLSSDTTLNIDFALEVALKSIRSAGLLGDSQVARIAIVGPGLDFTDKAEGFDFYPLQTIQPFAIMDSMARLGLAKPSNLHVTTFDLSPRIINHLNGARRRAISGEPYVLDLPLEKSSQWNPQLLAYWKALGDRIGDVAPAKPSPEGVDVRTVHVRSVVASAIAPQDLNIVVQRQESLHKEQRFDVVIATNVLVYYGVFEQSLALSNIAAMLRPGGVFLSNGPVFQLPAVPIHFAGSVDVKYRPDLPTGSDRIYWYQRD